MGIDQHLFLDPIDEELICSICSDVYDTPVTGCEQGHLFCESCLRQWISVRTSRHAASTSASASVPSTSTCPCPIDRHPLHTQLTRVRTVENIVSKLIVTCRYACNDEDDVLCTWTGPYRDLQSHITTCEWAPVECPNKGCQWSTSPDPTSNKIIKIASSHTHHPIPSTSIISLHTHSSHRTSLLREIHRSRSSRSSSPHIKRSHSPSSPHSRKRQRISLESPLSVSSSSSSSSSTTSSPIPLLIHTSSPSSSPMPLPEVSSPSSLSISTSSHASVSHSPIISSSPPPCPSSPTLRRRSLASHLTECHYRHITCTSCSSTCRFMDYDSHLLSSCPQTLIPCPNATSGCTANFPRIQQDSHLETCTYHIIPCLFANAGCTHRGIRSTMEQHLSENMTQHLSLVMIQNNKLQQEIQTLTSQQQTTTATIAALDTTCTELRRRLRHHTDECTTSHRSWDTRMNTWESTQSQRWLLNDARTRELTLYRDSNSARLLLMETRLLAQQNTQSMIYGGYEWSISNFSSYLTRPHFTVSSPSFEIAGKRFLMHLVRSATTPDQVGLFLHLQSGKSATITFTVTLLELGRTTEQQHIRRESTQVYDPEHSSWGYPNFISWQQFTAGRYYQTSDDIGYITLALSFNPIEI